MCDARERMRSNLALSAAVCVLALVAWFGVLRPDSEQDKRERGARTYCETLLSHGVLLEPMADCLREYAEQSR